MELKYKSSPVSFDANELLFNAQLIADAFAETLKQNNCMVMLPIALHDEIITGIKDIEDGLKIVEEESKPLPEGGGIDSEHILDSVRDSIKYSKERCFNCEFTIPRPNFKYDFNSIMGDLKATIDLYRSIFDMPKLDLCQGAYSLKNNCLPDILRLIVLLLTAYASIMMLKSITSISLQSFIKGVLSTIISKIFAALRLNVSIGDTNMACLINALKEISTSLIPTDETIRRSINSQDLDAIGYTEDKKLFDNEYTKTLNDGLNVAEIGVNNIETSINILETKIEETFRILSDTLNEATQEINDLILNMLALKSTFECETARSGTDITTVMERVNRLMQTINMLSAVALASARRDSYDKACSSNRSINRLTDKQLENQKIKDIIEEYYEKEVEIIDNPDTGIQIIIKDDKPKPPVLNKLDFFQCSIDDFIVDHTLDTIIKKVEDENEERGTVIRDPVEKEPGTPIGEGSYVIPPVSDVNLNIIESIVDILYTDPSNSEDAEDFEEEESKSKPESIEDIINSFGTDTVSDEFIRQNRRTINKTLNCRNTSDVLNILENIRKTM